MEGGFEGVAAGGILYDTSAICVSAVGKIGSDIFELTYLSIITIIGATITAAEAAAVRSVPSLRPKFLVFHFRDSDVVCPTMTGVGLDKLVMTTGLFKPLASFLSSIIAEPLRPIPMLYILVKLTANGDRCC